MKTTLPFLAATLLFLGVSLHAAPPASPAPSQQPPAASQGPDCSKLSQDEQAFAAQLVNPDNKIMFCTQFSSRLRQEAMQKMAKAGSGAGKMSADLAVERVMASNGLLPPSMQQKPKTYGGSCPVQ